MFWGHFLEKLKQFSGWESKMDCLQKKGVPWYYLSSQKQADCAEKLNCYVTELNWKKLNYLWIIP